MKAQIRAFLYYLVNLNYTQALPVNTLTFVQLYSMCKVELLTQGLKNFSH